jgi:hypothetical protein
MLKDPAGLLSGQVSLLETPEWFPRKRQWLLIFRKERLPTGE